jgi:hypothetical protein
MEYLKEGRDIADAINYAKLECYPTGVAVDLLLGTTTGYPQTFLPVSVGLVEPIWIGDPLMTLHGLYMNPKGNGTNWYCIAEDNPSE